MISFLFNIIIHNYLFFILNLMIFYLFETHNKEQVNNINFIFDQYI